MTADGISDKLRAAIIAAIEAYEQDEMPVHNLASTTDAWRARGRRMQMSMRYATARTLQGLPFRRRVVTHFQARTS